MKALSIFLTRAWLLAFLSIFGCVHNAPVIKSREITSQASLRPIDVEPSIAENIGREALQKIGYEEIIKLAEKAGFGAQQSCAQPRHTRAPPGPGPAQRSGAHESTGRYT